MGDPRRRSRFRRGRHAEHYQAGGLWGGLAEISLRVGLKFFDAAGATKVELLPCVLVNMLSGRGIDVHPADGIAS